MIKKELNQDLKTDQNILNNKVRGNEYEMKWKIIIFSCAKKAMWQIRVKQHLEEKSNNPSRDIAITFQRILGNYIKINSIV